MLFFCASKEKCRNITTFHHAGQGGPGDTLIRCACIIIPKIIRLGKAQEIPQEERAMQEQQL